MKKEGNGEAKTCLENLTSIIRGEIPFDRVRGIDARIIDKPENEAREELKAEIIWNAETYEPRVEAETVEADAELKDGEINIEIQIIEVEEDEED